MPTLYLDIMWKHEDIFIMGQEISKQTVNEEEKPKRTPLPNSRPIRQQMTPPAPRRTERYAPYPPARRYVSLYPPLGANSSTQQLQPAPRSYASPLGPPTPSAVRPTQQNVDDDFARMMTQINAMPSLQPSRQHIAQASARITVQSL